MLTPFGRLCATTETNRGTLSTIYKMLVDPGENHIPSFITAWETELGVTFAPTQVTKMLELAQRVSLSNSTRRRVTKYLVLVDGTGRHRRYTIFSHQCRPSVGDAKITEEPIELSPEVLLLHSTKSSVGKYRKSLTIHLVNSARACIPARWKSTTPPTVGSWIRRVEDISRMEDLTALLQRTEEKHRLRWMPWFLFMESAEGKTLRDETWLAGRYLGIDDISESYNSELRDMPTFDMPHKINQGNPLKRVAVVEYRKWDLVSPCCTFCLTQRLSTWQGSHLTLPKRCLGQPSPFTHPHLLKPGEVTPGLTQTEYALRRHQLMDLIKKEAQMLCDTADHAVVILANPTMYMTSDIPFPFHQHNDFLYLCGFLEPDSILLLQSQPRHVLPSHSATLYVPHRDPSRELWDGPRSGVDGTTALTGVDQALPIEDFKHIVPKLLDEGVVLWYDFVRPPHTSLHTRFLLPLLETKSKYKHKIKSPRHLIQQLRLIKSEAELELMKKSASITSRAFIETMHFSKAPINESLLYAKFDFECRARGADILAYLPVVAGGSRANTLHYVKNNQVVKEGEMVLLDGGCEAAGYVSDVTRTWPVNGRFSAPQTELYESVLEVQKSCLNLCVSGTSLEHLYSHMLSELAKKLKDLGIVQNRCSSSQTFKAAQQYCPHHVGHYLGMDVHDTPDASRSLSLQPGMVITIEPGIYIPENDSDVPERYRGLGIRIEDDVIITEQSPVILSAECPKEIYEIHQVCGQGH
ncbi:xaa-Pro aminopeptidase 3 [Gastrophryne carolinensis]